MVDDMNGLRIREIILVHEFISDKSAAIDRWYFQHTQSYVTTHFCFSRYHCKTIKMLTLCYSIYTQDHLLRV